MALPKRQLKDEEQRKIFSKVFDNLAVEDLFKLKVRGYFDTYERMWKEGKESKILIVKKDDSYRIIKIYKIEAGGFKNMLKYLQGDERFRKVRDRRRDIIYAWCKKEFHNLMIAHKIGINSPEPYAYIHNILVMELLGDENPYPQLKEVSLDNPEKTFRSIIKNIETLVKKGKLVHGDISEFNILVDDKEKPYLIDFAQSVLISHPYAKEFLERDIRNIVSYFNSEYGLNVDFEETYQKIAGGVFDA